MKRRLCALMVLAGLLVLAFASGAQAQVEIFKARLIDSPNVTTEGSGQALFTLAADGASLDYELTVADLSNVTMAHIHLAPLGQDGPVVVWLYPEGPPAQLIPGVSTGLLARGTVTAASLVGPLEGMTMADLRREMRAANTYVNVHTSQQPTGEIRGQIQALSWSDMNAAVVAPYDVILPQVAGISDGFVDDTWRPSAPMTRGQYVKMAVDAFGLLPIEPASPTFTDVPATHTFFPYIEAAAQAQLVGGVGGGRFAPEATVTREQGVAVISRRLARQEGQNLETMFTDAEAAAILAPFNDDAQVGPNLVKEIAFAVQAKIVLGSAGNLSPKAELIRIQGAALLIRANRATVALPGQAVFPEGVAYDAASDDFFVGSTTDGTIFRGNFIDPEASIFLPGGAEGRTTAIGMKVDAEGRLIIAGGRTGMVWVYDTVSGQLIRSFSNGKGENETFLNDLTVIPNGDILITDSRDPVIYRIPVADLEPSQTPGNLEDWLRLEGTPIQFQEGTNLNGIALMADGAHVLTVQSNTGMLFCINLLTREVAEVDLGDLSLTGGDGLVIDGLDLYVVDHTSALVLELSPHLTSAGLKETITHPTFAFPTTAALRGGKLIVVNSQFDKRQTTPSLPFTVTLVDR